MTVFYVISVHGNLWYELRAPLPPNRNHVAALREYPDQIFPHLAYWQNHDGLLGHLRATHGLGGDEFPMNRATAKDRHSAEHPRPAAGQAPAPAQDRSRAGIERRHIRGETSNPARAYCTADNQDWPCDAIWLLSICTSYRDLPGDP